MKFLNKNDKSRIFYNENLTLKNIPLESYGYLLNGKSPIEWVMERQCIKQDNQTSLVNNANDFANETKENPAYPLLLLRCAITISLETKRIINSLPQIEFN